MARKNVKHIHVELDAEIYEKFREIVSEHGLISIVIRRLINEFIYKMSSDKQLPLFGGDNETKRFV